MIHGGPRYLTYDPDVTYSSCLDSGHIQHVAPHLLFRIPFLLPVFGRSEAVAKATLAGYDAFFSLYDRYQPLKRGKPHVSLRADELLRLEARRSVLRLRRGDVRQNGDRRRASLRGERGRRHRTRRRSARARDRDRRLATNRRQRRGSAVPRSHERSGRDAHGATRGERDRSLGADHGRALWPRARSGAATAREGNSRLPRSTPHELRHYPRARSTGVRSSSCRGRT